ncbi:MAG: hypothetical protein ACRYFS_21680 [Janthinobacterium lividum]
MHRLIILLLCTALPILLAILFLATDVRADGALFTNNTQTSDPSSKFFLLLEDDSLSSNQLYQAEIKQIDRLAQAQDLSGLVRIADRIEQTWGHKTDTRGYFALMDEVTDVLSSHTFAPMAFVKQYALTQKYVEATLAHSNVPLDITARFLPRLIPQEVLIACKRPFSEADWVQMRRTRTPLWLQTWQRLRQLVVPKYDFASPTFFNFPFDPEALQDPKQAEARRQAMEENSRKIEGRNIQLYVRFQEKLVSSMAENEVVTYYSRALYDLKELQSFLDLYVDDPATREKIVEQVARNMVEAPHE